MLAATLVSDCCPGRAGRLSWELSGRSENKPRLLPRGHAAMIGVSESGQNHQDSSRSHCCSPSLAISIGAGGLMSAHLAPLPPAFEATPGGNDYRNTALPFHLVPMLLMPISDVRPVICVQFVGNLDPV